MLEDLLRAGSQTALFIEVSLALVAAAGDHLHQVCGTAATIGLIVTSLLAEQFGLNLASLGGSVAVPSGRMLTWWQLGPRDVVRLLRRLDVGLLLLLGYYTNQQVSIRA